MRECPFFESATKAVRFILTLALLGAVVHAQSPTPDGSIGGTVSDQATGAPLAGATIRLDRPDRAAASDDSGRFIFENVPSGTYRLTISFLGYADTTIPSIYLPSDTARIELRIGLTPAPVLSKRIIVRGARDPQSDRAGTGNIVVTGETIAERPASLNDISRAISGMVPIARFDDRYPSLVVRGGSPIENGFYVDNIPIPSINHFPSQGAGSGPLGILSAHIIEDAHFYAGGFPVAFGDRLSSVFDITLRDGSRENSSGIAAVDLSGASLIVDGPLPNGLGSYLLSGRQGFLNLLMEMLNIDVSPDYADLHTKITFELDSLTRLSLLGLAGAGDLYLAETVSDNGGADFYGDTDYRNGTIGVNLDRHRLGISRSQTSLSASHLRRIDDHYTTSSRRRVYKNSSIEESISLRHSAWNRITERLTLHYGGEGHHRNADYHFLINPFADEGGYMSDTVVVNAYERYVDLGLWLETQWRFSERLSSSFGVRFDRWDFTDQERFSPRGSLHYSFTDRTAVYTAAGLYYQTLPLSLLLQQPSNRTLNLPRAVHVVLGFSHRLSESARFAVEGYSKRYSRMPMDPSQPTVFVLDELVYDYGFLPGHGPLVANGRATVRGFESSIDITLLGRLLLGFSGSIARAQYDDYAGVRRDRVIDNRLAFDLEARYRPADGWQINTRWVYGGGRPYTPYDTVLTRQLNGAVYDHTRANEVRYPSYHSLNVRLQHEFVFSGSRLTAYGEVWNTYDRNNVSGKYWDTEDEQFETVYQFPRLPIVGLEYRF